MRPYVYYHGMAATHLGGPGLPVLALIAALGVVLAVIAALYLRPGSQPDVSNQA